MSLPYFACVTAIIGGGEVGAYSGRVDGKLLLGTVIAIVFVLMALVVAAWLWIRWPA
jgi:hypothetical protein